jgi:phosphatidylglycerophosphate synthase
MLGMRPPVQAQPLSGLPLGPANQVTLVRATLALGVAMITAASFSRPAPVSILVALAAVALVLDGVDGWVARRTWTTRFGAHFDAEVDAFLILVLSIYVSRSAGAWVLAIGLARYAFLAAKWPLRWLRGSLPPRYWRKVVAATEGIVLTVAATRLLPMTATRIALAGGVVLIAESFGRDVWWLWRRREKAHGRTRAAVAGVLTGLALLLVWAELVAPDHPRDLTLGAFARIPLEGIAFVVIAVVLPAVIRKRSAWLLGPLLGLLVVLKLLDLGFYFSFDRPFDPGQDWKFAGTGIETLRLSYGRTDATLATVAVVVLVLAVLVVTTLAVRRLARVAARHGNWSLRAAAALGLAAALGWFAGAPVASIGAADLALREIRAVRSDIRDPAVFARAIRQDHFAATPGSRLLRGLRGKDVIVAFVESYGKVAVQGSPFAPQVDATLDAGTRRLQAAGFAARSGFLTSATFGGISWLGHSTLQSGLWVNSQRRYDQLVKTNRLTLSLAFKRAGWRTVADVPSNDRAWKDGSAFYHYDKVYDRRNVGYRGPTFTYASMPDQYVLAALQRLELAKRSRRPLFAEIDLVSSHTPWTRIPQLIDWSAVGDGSIYKTLPAGTLSKEALWANRTRVREAYAQSIQYTLNALVSFVQHYGRKNLVLVLLGDHQPATIITGQEPSHDVPISIVAHDPKVLQRVGSWGWRSGLRPGPRAPVWPMSAFRDRFLRAFGSTPAAGGSA